MELKDFFQQNNQVAIAFSGGVDSAYLLYMAKKYCRRVSAYYVKTVFQPEFEFNDAKRLAEELEVDMRVIELDVLSDEEILANPSNRCYYCKKRIFSAIVDKASEDGFHILLDGTNASDDFDDRPGMKALIELEVLSPLRLCGLTKAEIRRLSKEAGLFTWDKPAYACLATRIPTGCRIDATSLEKTENCEEYLMSQGFSDFRIRMFENTARIQVRASQINLLIEKRADIVCELKKYYSGVLLDLEVRDE